MASITEISPSSDIAKVVLVAHTTLAAVTQRRRSNAIASETQYALKASPGKATSIRITNPKAALKVSITGYVPH